jgi:hypothetical protein
LEELDKVECSGLSFNQIIRVIRCYILNKLNYIFANTDIPDKYLKEIEQKLRNIILRFVKEQSLQKSFLYTNVRNGGLGLPCMKDEYRAYKVHDIAHLMSVNEPKEVLK